MISIAELAALVVEVPVGDEVVPPDSWALQNVRKDWALGRAWVAHLGGDGLDPTERAELRGAIAQAAEKARSQFGAETWAVASSERALAEFDSRQAATAGAGRP